MEFGRVFYPGLFLIMKPKDMDNAKSKITRKELIRQVAHRSGHTIKDTEEIMRATFDAIQAMLYNQVAVEVTRFGVFSIAKTKGGVSRLPGQEKIYVPPKFVPKFRFAHSFKQQMKNIKIEERQQAFSDDELPFDEEL